MEYSLLIDFLSIITPSASKREREREREREKRYQMQAPERNRLLNAKEDAQLTARSLLIAKSNGLQ